MAPSKSKSGHFNLLYFAAACSFTKKQSEHLPAPIDAKDLFSLLETNYPGIKDKVLNSSMLTVNLEYVDLDDEQGLTIQEGDEVAIIPPVSSG
jgi:molybdopterin converting factor small subunit